MIELLGLAGGAIVRLFPTVLSFFKEGRDLKYELLRMDKQAELERLRYEQRKGEIAAIGDAGEQIAWAQALQDAMKSAVPEPLKDTGSRWLNFFNVLNTSVRPILTYWWCVLLVTVEKVFIILIAIQQKVALEQFRHMLVTDFDRGVIASIIGFWFVDRFLRGPGK